MDLPLPDRIAADRIGPDAPVLASERDRVLALLPSAPVVGTLLVPSINSGAPIVRLDPRLQVKLTARAGMGLDLQGQDYPTRYLWSRAIGNASAAIALDAGLLILAFVFDWALWRAILAIILVVLLCVVGYCVSVTLRDPHRLTRAERRALHRAGHWRSTQAWDGYTTTRPEFQLVREAAKIAARIANSRAWTSSYLDHHRARLDLGAELDRIDEQAFQLARTQVDLASAPAASAGLTRYADALAPVWVAAVDRVAALLRYADHVAELDRQLAELALLDRTEQQVGRLIGGSVQDEFSTDQLRQLTGELGYLQIAVRDTTLMLQSDTQAITDR